MEARPRGSVDGDASQGETLESGSYIICLTLATKTHGESEKHHFVRGKSRTLVTSMKSQLELNVPGPLH